MPNTPGRFAPINAVVWAVVLFTVFATAVLQFTATAYLSSLPVSRDAPNLEFTMQSKLAVGTNHLFGRVLGRDALRGAKLYAHRPIDRLHLVMVTGEIAGADAAQKALTRLAENDVLDAEQARNAETLHAIYRQETPAADALDALIDDNGWFGRLAASFGRPPSDPQRQAVLAAGTRVVAVLFGAFVAMLAMGTAGLTLMILAIVFLATGRLRPTYRPIRTRKSAVFLEAFAVFMVLMLVMSGGALLVYYWTQIDLGPAAVVSMPLGLVWLRLRGLSWASIRRGLGLSRGRGVWREIGAGLIGYLAGLPVLLIGFIGTILVSIVVPVPGDGAHPIAEELQNGGIVWILMLYLLAVVWAPIFEELLFRGAFYHHVRSRFGFVLSALIVGFLFAAIHPQGLIGIPVLTAIAFVLAAIREWRGSILGPMIAHAFNNFCAVTLMLLLFR